MIVVARSRQAVRFVRPVRTRPAVEGPAEQVYLRPGAQCAQPCSVLAHPQMPIHILVDETAYCGRLRGVQPHAQQVAGPPLVRVVCEGGEA